MSLIEFEITILSEVTSPAVKVKNVGVAQREMCHRSTESPATEFEGN